MNKLVVIAGAGDYPRLIVEGAKMAGVARVDVCALKGSTPKGTCRVADSVHWFTIGDIVKMIRLVSAEGYDGAILAGQVNPLSLFRAKFDPEVKEWLAELPVKNAHTVFGKLIEKIELFGTRVLPASLFMEDHIPGAGQVTARGLTEMEASDICHAERIVADMGRHDVGQTVVVKSGMVLAVEAFEGTNAAIRRAGKLGGFGSVIFKGAREGHDMRFDIPVIGMKTVKTMRKAGVTALAFQAGRLVLFDREKVVSFCDKHGIAIVGMPTSLPPAPTRIEEEGR